MKLSLFLGIGAVGVGVVFALLAVAALCDPHVGAAFSVMLAAISAAFFAVAHHALLASPPGASAAEASGASS